MASDRNSWLAKLKGSRHICDSAHISVRAEMQLVSNKGNLEVGDVQCRRDKYSSRAQGKNRDFKRSAVVPTEQKGSIESDSISRDGTQKISR